ncbi:MAG TPA: hypothetical protein VGY56_06730, partial [Verrucomicrobiae bacterium]|nr:hypothetical protein [Verrucomicrobiae bacterium]
NQPCNEPDLRLVDRHTRVAPGIAGGKPHRSLYPRVLEKMPFFNGLLGHATTRPNQKNQIRQICPIRHERFRGT